MEEKIRKIIESESASLISEVLEASKKLTLEEFSAELASRVTAKLPTFTRETKRDFDDPYDSFSTSIFERFVTNWV